MSHPLLVGEGALGDGLEAQAVAAVRDDGHDEVLLHLLEVGVTAAALQLVQDADADVEVTAHLALAVLAAAAAAAAAGSLALIRLM